MLHILGDEPRDVDPTMEDLKRMEYMTLIIKEVCARKLISYYCLLKHRQQRTFAGTDQLISYSQETLHKTSTWMAPWFLRDKRLASTLTRFTWIQRSGIIQRSLFLSDSNKAESMTSIQASHGYLLAMDRDNASVWISAWPSKKFCFPWFVSKLFFTVQNWID